jgi:glycosyltransferase involved in cell wall biosynthesis
VVTEIHVSWDRNINVTHVALQLQLGGLERVVLSLVREGMRLGQRVSVLCLEDTGPLADEATSLGAEVRCLHKAYGLSPRMLWDVPAMLRKLAPDVVHTHQIGPLFYTGKAARRAGAAVVVHTEHGKHYGKLQTRWLGKLAARSADCYFCVSRDVADAVIDNRILAADRVTVVPNGIDTARFARSQTPSSLRHELRIPDGAAVIGTVANLREVKRQDVLIRGFARLKPQSPRNPHLLLVGDGPMREKLTRLAAALGVAERVHFVGAQADPQRFLHAMDVFALTSASEGMPLAVLEAWAAGIPVVASRVGGLPELVGASRAGFMFDAGDLTGLTTQIEQLLSAPGCARRMGRAGQVWVRRYCDVALMASAYHRHYLSLLQNARSPLDYRAALPMEASPCGN